MVGNVLNRTTKEYREGVILDIATYPVAEWIWNPDLTDVEGVMRRYWKVVGDEVIEMSPAEKVALDATDLPVYKAGRKVRLKSEMETYIESRYTLHALAMLALLEAEAIVGSMANRKAYVAELQTWLGSIWSSIAAKEAAIDALTTIEAVENYAWDLASEFDGTDPECTVAGAYAIAN